MYTPLQHLCEYKISFWLIVFDFIFESQIWSLFSVKGKIKIRFIYIYPNHSIKFVTSDFYLIKIMSDECHSRDSSTPFLESQFHEQYHVKRTGMYFIFWNPNFTLMLMLLWILITMMIENRDSVDGSCAHSDRSNRVWSVVIGMEYCTDWMGCRTISNSFVCFCYSSFCFSSQWYLSFSGSWIWSSSKLVLSWCC